MIRAKGRLAAAFALLCGLTAQNASALAVSPHAGTSGDPPARYLISFETDADPALILSAGGRVIRAFQDPPALLAELPAEQAARLRLAPRVEAVEPDAQVRTLPVQPEASGGDAVPGSPPALLPESPQQVPWGIGKVHAPEVQRLGFTGKGVKIGVIDSGIDDTHEDLAVAGGVSFVEGSPDYRDDFGHGTAVAGIIGAKDNGIGVVGVAPDAGLYAIKVLNSSGTGQISDVVSGIEWAVRHKLDIVNLSLDSPEGSHLLKKAVKAASKKGLLLVAAAGNRGFNEGDTIAYPAAYPEVIAVGAINSRGERTFYSGVGNDLELMAPGASIYSTAPNNRYALNIGTSMAAPHVTGIAAQLREAHPRLKAKALRKLLAATAVPMGDRAHYGFGLVDALRALSGTKAAVPLPEDGDAADAS